MADVFDDNAETWTKMSEDARSLMATQFEQGALPKIDDIKKALLPLVELNPIWREYSQKKKLKEKYWISDFTDYILHRIYEPTLNAPEG